MGMTLGIKWTNIEKKRKIVFDRFFVFVIFYYFCSNKKENERF